jgi:two-component system, NtrC family, sensor kinase
MTDRILLVDDDLRVRTAYSRLLASFGCDVTSTGDGRDACNLVRSAVSAGHPFAVAVVDRAMPGWDGFTTIENAWTHDPDLQVVLCTGSDCSKDDIDARFAATDGFLVMRKPVDAAELFQATRALAKKRRAARRERARIEELEAAVDAGRLWRERIENEARLTQRLDAVGQLAAGIAHEINSPVQYVGDNARFLCEATEDLIRYIDILHQLAATERGLGPILERCDAEIELAYVRSEVPSAAKAMFKGIARIGSIVGALRELSHPGGEAAKGDVNRALQNALEVTANAYRYHCDVELELGTIPEVTCHISELGQVFVNLIVNAAHAMETPARTSRGRLGIRTRADGDCVVIEISDSGSGIPVEIRDKIFEPFFTTKVVGRGTGQGLAIAKSIIVERHGGELGFETEVARGTTFIIRLPIEGRR